MELIKQASGKTKIKMSKKEWTDMGKKAGWLTKSAWNFDKKDDEEEKDDSEKEKKDNKKFAGLNGNMGKLFNPLLEKHDSEIRSWVIKKAEELRTRLQEKFKDSEEVRAAVREGNRRWKPGQPHREDLSLLEVWREWSFPQTAIHTAREFNYVLDKTIKANIESNRQKLEAAIDKSLGNLLIVAVEEVYSSVDNGIQGRYLIRLKDGSEGYFETKSIPSGGHNIQRFHYRYRMKVDRSLAESDCKLNS